MGVCELEVAPDNECIENTDADMDVYAVCKWLPDISARRRRLRRGVPNGKHLQAMMAEKAARESDITTLQEEASTFQDAAEDASQTEYYGSASFEFASSYYYGGNSWLNF